MPKFKNVDVHDRFIPALVRTVKSGEVVDVPDDLVAGFTVGAEEENPHPYWEAVVDAPAVTPPAPVESPAPVQ